MHNQNLINCPLLMRGLHFHETVKWLAGQQELSPGEGPVLRVREWGGLLLFSTQRGGLHAWDLRAGKDAWRIPCPPNQVPHPMYHNASLCKTSSRLPWVHETYCKGSKFEQKVVNM